jgi:hypothetical protein
MARINSAALREVQETLPPELREMLRTLSEQYLAASETHVGRAFVSYRILAEIIRSGWRQT